MTRLHRYIKPEPWWGEDRGEEYPYTRHMHFVFEEDLDEDDWFVSSRMIASCTSQESAEAAYRLLSGECVLGSNLEASS